jgi:hypothetical protein
MITASHNPAADNGVKLIDPRGEMLEASWEGHATRVCNARDPAELVGVLQKLVDTLQIDTSVKPRVIFGRDTRPSGEGLALALSRGLAAIGLDEAAIGFKKGEQPGTCDKGIVTTPILHYLVRAENTQGKGELEEYGAPTVQGYYDKMATAFRKLTVCSFAPVDLARLFGPGGARCAARWLTTVGLGDNPTGPTCRTRKRPSPSRSRSTVPTVSARPSSPTLPRSSPRPRPVRPGRRRSCSYPSRRRSTTRPRSTPTLVPTTSRQARSCRPSSSRRPSTRSSRAR